jgi:hypothetical protein
MVTARARQRTAHCCWELEMSLRYMFLGILLFAIGVAAPAHANSLFVASNGNDVGACTRTAPCLSIGAAINLAFPNDTIICLDPCVKWWIFYNQIN